jgi:hypothetical protein
VLIVSVASFLTSRLGEDRGLLAVEAAHHLGAAPLGLAGILAHPVEGPAEVVLALGEHPLDLAGRDSRRHREAQDLAQLALQPRELRHLQLLTVDVE